MTHLRPPIEDIKRLWIQAHGKLKRSVSSGSYERRCYFHALTHLNHPGDVDHSSVLYVHTLPMIRIFFAAP